MYQHHNLQLSHHGEFDAMGLEHFAGWRLATIHEFKSRRMYDEHVIYVLNAARMNWRFPYLPRTKLTPLLPFAAGSDRDAGQ